MTNYRESSPTDSKSGVWYDGSAARCCEKWIASENGKSEIAIGYKKPLTE